MPDFHVTFDRTVTFRTTINARNPDEAALLALKMGDDIDGEVAALHALDEFSIVVREPVSA